MDRPRFLPPLLRPPLPDGVRSVVNDVRVSINARMRVPTKRMANMGQNITTPLQFSIVWVNKAHSKPVNSFTVMAAQIQMYTKKNWKVRLITHCMVGEIGMVYSGPFGCSISKIE